MSEFSDKLKTINIGRADRRGPKKTVDVHDHHKVEVTEHWSEQVDVNVIAPQTALNPHIRPMLQEEKA